MDGIVAGVGGNEWEKEILAIVQRKLITRAAERREQQTCARNHARSDKHTIGSDLLSCVAATHTSNQHGLACLHDPLDKKIWPI